jgi:chemotaxis protein CheX
MGETPMSTAALESIGSLNADPVMLKALTDAVDACMTMCDTSAACVGVSTIPSREPGMVTGMIGVHGNVSGFVTVNLAEHVALTTVGGLLQDRFDSLNAQVIDGVGEIANVISGGVKKGLAGTKWAFSHVTVPSVIIGRNYEIAYARGLQYLCATFEHKDSTAIMLHDRLLTVAISLIRL